jgi:hypothetical protein
MKLAHVPMANSRTSAITPTGRALDLPSSPMGYTCVKDNVGTSLEWLLVSTTLLLCGVVDLTGGRERANLRPHSPETCNLTVRLLRCDHFY